MKRITFTIVLTILMFVNGVPQSLESQIKSVGGFLLSELSNKKEIRILGDAIRKSGEMQFEIERIKAQNTRYNSFSINYPNRVITKDGEIFPKKGYEWKNPEISDNYEVKKIESANFNEFEEWRSLALSFFKIHEWKQVINYSSKFLSEKHDCSLYFMRGISYRQLNNLDKAQDDLSHANLFCRSIEGMSGTVYFFKGLIAYTQKDYNESSENFSKAISYNIPKNHMVTAFIYKSEIKLINNYNADIQKDLSMIENMLNEVEITSARDYFMLAKIYLATENYDKSYKYCNKALLLDENHALALYCRGLTSLSLGLNESAIEDIQKAADLGCQSAITTLKEIYPNK